MLIIDLTQPFTTDDVARLLASKDDSVQRQLRVNSAGQAFLSDTVGNSAISDLAFRFMTWDAGNDYYGPKAAADRNYVLRIERVLRANWPNPLYSYINSY